VFASLQRKLDAVLSFEIDNDQIVQRLGGRTVCEKCQTPYTGRNAGEKCDKCGGTLVRRKDDEPDAISNRLKVYDQQTAPVFNWYSRNGTRLATVQAVGSVDEVTKRALKALGR
jgi:adenylate kinase